MPAFWTVEPSGLVLGLQRLSKKVVKSAKMFWRGCGLGVGDGVERRGFEDALGLAVVGVFGDAVVGCCRACPA